MRPYEKVNDVTSCVQYGLSTNVRFALYDHNWHLKHLLQDEGLFFKRSLPELLIRILAVVIPHLKRMFQARNAKSRIKMNKILLPKFLQSFK